MENVPVLVPVTDHDLLIRVDEKLSQLSVDVKELKDNTQNRLGIAEGRIIALEKAFELLKGRSSGISSFWSVFIQIATLVLTSATMLTLILHLLNIVK
jgi:hypothetical protein